MPTVDDLLGAAPEKKMPSVNDLLDAPPKVDYGTASMGISSPILDEYVKNSSIGKVLSAFGHGFKEGWGTEPLGLNKEQEQAFKDAKIFNDYENGQTSIIKSFNEVMLRPAAAGLDVLLRAGTGAFRAAQGTVAQTGEELQETSVGKAIDVQGLARDIAAMPEAFMGTPHPTGTPRALTMAELQRAQDLGIIGKGEAGWKGTAEQLDINNEAIKRLSPSQEGIESRQPVNEPATPKVAEVPTAEAQAEPPMDIHAVAREIAPETFKVYDDLSTKRDTYRRWLGDLTEQRLKDAETSAPQTAEIAGLEEKLQDATPRLAKKYEARLAELTAERGKFVEEKTSSDTPDMKTVRAKLQEADYKMRDLAPEVSKAYRDAQEQMPQEAAPVEPSTAAEAPPETVLSAAEPAPAAPQAPTEPTAPKAPPIDIASDISSKLVEAGRPTEEANATAALIKSHYEARAARFNGALGTAEELYAKEGPQIRAPGQKAVPTEVAKEREFAQSQPDQPTFYSGLTKAAETAKLEKGTGAQWKATIKNTSGIKQEEIDWSGINQWLDEQKGPVTKQQVADFLKENQVKIEEVVKGAEPAGLADAKKAFDQYSEELAKKYNLNPAQNLAMHSRLKNMDSAEVAKYEQLQHAWIELKDQTKPGKFASYTIPGGENYRELLLTLPPGKTMDAIAKEKGFGGWTNALTDAQKAEIERAYDAQKMPATGFSAGHFEEPNVVAHIRFNERTDADGKRVLFIEEIQSDWHQKGRKEGYRPEKEKRLEELVKRRDELQALGHDATPEQKQEWADAMNEIQRLGKGGVGVPDAPFKQNWQELAFKRALRWAAEHDFDKVAWTTGEQQAARYDLSKQVEKIRATKLDNGKTNIRIEPKGGDPMQILVGNDGVVETMHNNEFTGRSLADVIGKEMADKISNDMNEGAKGWGVKNRSSGNWSQRFGTKEEAEAYQRDLPTSVRDTTDVLAMAPQVSKEYAGIDLKIGGEGMKGFYDKILPSFANKYAKKWGTKVEETYLKGPNVEGIANDDAQKGAAIGASPVHSLDITEPMRESVMQGQPLFQANRGKIAFKNDQAVITLFKDADASTFLHETGHQWLEELMGDARNEKAPADLITDAKTVRDWLGADEGSQISRKQHEKFARGFERYLMEGRAPSQALADVFARFKEWLTQIYQTVAKLRSPINDDIRAVFDRLISEKPERTVIAPDTKTEADFASIHEDLAAKTVPEQAHPVATQVRSEADTHALSNKEIPDVAESIGARAAEVGRGNPPEGPQANRGGNEGRPEPVSKSVSGETGTVSPSGAGTPAEGPKARPEPVSPHDEIPRSETELIDKAGNIRLDNLNTPEDVSQVIRDAADANNDFISARRSVISDSQVLDLADALGMDPAMLNQRKLGQAFNAEQIVAARKLLVKSAVTVRDAMAKAATGTDADVLAYAEAKTRHQMIQEQVSGITAEAGRALRAFRGIEGMKDAQALNEFFQNNLGKTPAQLRKEAILGSSLDTPEKISKFVNDSKKPTFMDMIQEFWINALLSGPITHVKNIIGNTAVAVLSVTETAGAAGIGKIRELAGNKGERVTVGDARSALFGMVQGAQDGLIAAKYAFTHEEQYTRAQTLEQKKFQAIPSARVIVARYEEGSREYNSRLSDIANARARAERLTGERLTGRVNDLIANPTPDMAAEAGEKAFDIGGKQVRTPGRFLTAEDELFKSIGYRQKLNELAHREATKAGLEGDALNQKIADLVTNPSEKLMEEATNFADYQTFTNSLGKVGRALQQFSNSHFLAKMVVPFIRTPLNLLKYANERTPLGAIFSREVKDNLAGRHGKIAQDTQIARIAIGTALGVSTMMMAQEGIITGGGPSDSKQKAMLMMTGWRPYSIKIGDTYYSYGWLDPFSTIMGISADMSEAAKAALGDEADWSKIGYGLFASISKNIMSKASLRGASDILNAVTDPDRYGPRYLQNLAGTVIPSALAQQARVNDEYQRETRTVLDSLRSRIPGMRGDLFPRRDVWGEPIPQGQALGPDSFSPIAESQVNNDPVNQKLIELKIFPGKLSREIRGVKLTDQQYDDFSRIAGRMAKVRLDAIVNIPGFGSIPDSMQRKTITDAIDSSHESARSLIIMQNPDILRQSLDAKVKKLTGETVH